MKILIDEMDDGWDEKLKELGVSPKKSLPPSFNEMIDLEQEEPGE